jgi:pimeloyl-ACP methyl ester carboxylesterase
VKRVLGSLVAAWTAWRLFGPEFAPRFATPQRHPARVPGRTLFVGEREFMVRESGNAAAPPVFLLHGWGYDSIATWHHVVGHLAGHFRVIMLDQRNHGGSAHLRGGFDIDDLADDAAGVLDALEVGPVTVIGYSMGGMVAQALARRHPGKVSRLVLGATAAYPIGDWRIPVRLSFIIARGLGRVSMIEWAQAVQRYLVRVGAVDARNARWLWEMLLNRDPRLAFEAGAAVWHFDSRDWIGSIDVPALVIIPTADQLIPPSRQRELADLMGRATVVELAGAKHEAVLTHGAAFAEAVVGFVP